MHEQTISPRCMRCNREIHGGYPHHNHETSEHDTWWDNQQAAEDLIQRIEEE